VGCSSIGRTPDC